MGGGTVHRSRAMNRQPKTTSAEGGQPWARSTRSLTLLAAALAAAVSGTPACQPDTRISVNEFLEMQRTDAPTTQPAQADLTPWKPGPYRLGSGDTLEITIAGLDAVGLPGTFTLQLNEQGQVTLPSVGSVELRGLTLDEVRQKVHQAYVPGLIRETEVVARILEYRTIEVLVMGEVNTPSAAKLRADQSSVLRAILEAGGTSPVADGNVTLIPADNPTLAIGLNLNDRSDLMRAARPGTLQDADVIVVERSSSDMVYVEGLVNNPGPIPKPARTDMSVSQAIAAAGGTLHAFAPQEATLMRRGAAGELTRVKIDLHAVSRGDQPDLAMKPGDVLVVPHTSGTRFEEFVARTFVLRWGLDGTFNPWTYYFFQRDFDLRQEQADNSDFFSTFGRAVTAQPPEPVAPVP